MSSVNYRDMKESLKNRGEIPEWYSTNSLQFFMDKYSFNGESVRSRDSAVAKYLAEHSPLVYPDWWEKDEYTKGKTYEQVFFNLIWDGFAVLSTPLKANGGLPDRGMTVSCCGQELKNSIASKALVRAELETLIKNAHGCSMNLSDWLHEGQEYGDNNISAGVLPVMEDMQKSTSEVNQGVRRGQTVFGVDVEHGDFWKIAQYLFENSDELNISWIMKDSFRIKLESKDQEMIDRWNRILYIRMATGKGYFTKVDTMNRNKATTFKNLGLEVKGSNLCVAPETMILTDKGYEVISDLENQTVNVWNGQEWSETVVVKTGENQKIIKVVTSFNQEIECTPYHKFYVQNGTLGRGGFIEKKEAQDLKIGDKLIKFELPIISGDLVLDAAYTNGFYSGDGCLIDGHPNSYLYHAKRDLLPKLENVHSVYHDPKNNRIKVKHFNLKNKFFVPTAEYTVESRLNWLSGLCDSDGTVSRNGDNESLQISNIQLAFLQETQLMLQTLGVTSTINVACEEGYKNLPLNDGSGENGLYFCQKAYRLLINSTSLFKLSELGFKTHRLSWIKRKPHRECDRFMTIKDVVDLGRFDDTYCLNEPKRNMAMFNGILTGNCNEVNLPVSDKYSFTCVIINANLALWDSFPKHLFHILHIMQDCNVSGYLKQIENKTNESRFLLNKVHNFTKDFRAVGTGTCGIHTLFMNKMIVVGSIESFQLNNKIFKKMRSDLDECNKWLADVMGVPDGIKDAGLHLRNATVMMSPPTKSSTELARETPTEGNGLQTSLIKVKETVGGEIFRIDTSFLSFMKSKGMYNPEEVARIAKNKGSCQDCEWMTSDEKAVFRNAFEIPMDAHLNLCSDRQKYFDQQQSINLYFSNSDSEEYIAEIHKKALEDDMCNGLYYCYSSRGGSYTRIKECEVCQ